MNDEFQRAAAANADEVLRRFFDPQGRLKTLAGQAVSPAGGVRPDRPAVRSGGPVHRDRGQPRADGRLRRLRDAAPRVDRLRPDGSGGRRVLAQRRHRAGQLLPGHRRAETAPPGHCGPCRHCGPPGHCDPHRSLAVRAGRRPPRGDPVGRRATVRRSRLRGRRNGRHRRSGRRHRPGDLPALRRQGLRTDRGVRPGDRRRHQRSRRARRAARRGRRGPGRIAPAPGGDCMRRRCPGAAG